MPVDPTLERLSAATVDRLPTTIARPGYDRRQLKSGIVHLGLGAFFRAFGALYVEDAIAREGGDWGIIGASLKRPDQRDRLSPQNGLYTALERGPGGDVARVVGSVLDVLVAPEDPDRLVEAMANSSIRIVTLTVTEKGYCHDPATGRLDRDHADIRHDLSDPARPASAVGFLVEALARRRARGLRPFTVLCCDNLPHNGRVVAGLVGEFASLRDPDLAAWIAAEATFPATMVDRIVPATTAEDIGRVAALTGLRDEAPVIHEPFCQFVIEDRFVDGIRPDFGAVGVELVEDVTPFELMKLRMLNGTHSALAYLGYLAGHETIVDTVSDPVFARFVDRLWREEIIPAVPPPPGTDLSAYADALLERYRNPAIRHRTWQIAMDGSQKLPQRLLGTVRARLSAGGRIDRLALAVAAWIRYVGGIDEKGAVIDVRDPLAGALAAALEAAGTDPANKVRAVLAFDSIFGSDLKDSEPFLSSVTAAYEALLSEGARGAAAALDLKSAQT